MLEKFLYICFSIDISGVLFFLNAAIGFDKTNFIQYSPIIGQKVMITFGVKNTRS